MLKHNCGLLTLCIMFAIYYYYFVYSKESYKRQRRKGIRSGWKRKGKSGVTVATTGTRYPKFPSGKDIEYIFDTSD